MFPASTKAGGMSFAFPDVCKVPTPAGPVPTPFPNIAQLPMADGSKCSTKVKIQNMQIFTAKSEIPLSNGDEAGTAGGVVSGVNMNKMKPTMFKPMVQVEGNPIVTQMCTAGQNGTSPNAPRRLHSRAQSSGGHHRRLSRLASPFPTRCQLGILSLFMFRSRLRSRSRVGLLAPSLGASLLLACAHDPGPLPVCIAELAEEDALELKTRNLSPEAWWTSLLPGYDRSRGEVERPVVDCSGETVRWTETREACVELDPLEKSLPPAPLSPQDITLSYANDDRMLVWLVTERYAGGEGSGPVAIIEWRKHGIAVRGLGTLRAASRGASLRLEAIGEHTVLLAEGKRCSPTDPDDCWRSIRILPLVGTRFQSGKVRSADGSCLGPLRFDKSRSVDLPHDQSGWIRRFELSTRLEFLDEELLVHESVSVSEIDPEEPEGTPRPFRTIEETRILKWRGKNFQSDRPSLWIRVLTDFASVDKALEPGERVPADADDYERPEVLRARSEGASEKDGESGKAKKKKAKKKPEVPKLDVPEAPAPEVPTPAAPEAPAPAVPEAPAPPASGS